MNVYMIQNTVTGAVYIGKTNTPRKRQQTHFHKTQNAHLRNAISKYGKDAFEFSVLETFATEQEAYEQEAWWIAYLRSIGAQLYNLREGGMGGWVATPATRAKMRLARLGKEPPNKGVKHTPEAIAKMRDRVFSEETRAKMRASRKNQVCTPETRAKRAQAFKGRKHTPEAKEKIREASRGNQNMRGRTRSAEAIEKTATALTGRPLSEAHKASLRAGWVKRKARALDLGATCIILTADGSAEAEPAKKI